MKYSFLLLFLCLPLLAGREFTVHKYCGNLQEETDKYYKLNFPRMSEKGTWFTVWKSYELNHDTVLIFNSSFPGQPVFYRTKIRNLFFLSNNNLLMQGHKQVELFNPVKQTSIYFNGVEQIKVLKNNRQYLLFYNEEEKNRLELRDSSGRLLNAINHVSLFYTTESNHIYVIAKNESGNFEIVLFKDKTTETIYVTSRMISNLEPDPGGQGIMIYEKNPGNDFMEILYLDLTARSVISLKEVLPVSFQNGFREAIREGNIYFLKLLVNIEKEDSSLVDIWYGNDNQLEKKYFSPVRYLYFVWEPKEKRIYKTGNSQITKTVSIGNKRYFLSYDPYLLQDYTQPTQLKMNVYDRLKDCYDLIDTMSDELYTCPDGQYILYQKNKIWYVYRTVTGIKKAITNDYLITPYFTTDGKTILFEGEGGLWRYDLMKNELSQLLYIKGYQVTIQNAISSIKQKGLNFYEKGIDLSKPLVIRLYDPTENRSAYLLWKNGMCDTIVAPTSKRIQNMIYGNTYAQFIYTEEDYNLPPRLVYKKMGADEKVLYQSNKSDTAILSLNQEIIPYTNSDGVSLKGVLYYPLNYTPSEKYPMVVNIYEQQRHLSNKYPYPSYFEGLGFNIRLLVGKEYFVYLPDISIQGNKDKGPGLDALDCVNNALDAIAGNQSIDKQRIGLIGHSLGGYETDFIATHSSRFAAYVSGSGQSDILRAYYSFNYNFLTPDYRRIESGQYRMNIAFTDDKTLYFKNNPIYCAEKVNAPVLLWSGLEDENVTSDQTMAFYNALRRNRKDVIALFYKGEGHSLQKQQAQSDLTSKILDWFDYFLKNEWDVEWIRKGISKRRAL